MATIQNKFSTIKKGTTFNGRDIKIYDGLGSSKTPMNLTGVKIEMEFKNYESEPAVFKFSTDDNSITITALGVARMMPRTMNYPVAVYKTDLFITKNGSKKYHGTINWEIN